MIRFIRDDSRISEDSAEDNLSIGAHLDYAGPFFCSKENGGFLCDTTKILCVAERQRYQEKYGYDPFLDNLQSLTDLSDLDQFIKQIAYLPPGATYADLIQCAGAGFDTTFVDGVNQLCSYIDPSVELPDENDLPPMECRGKWFYTEKVQPLLGKVNGALLKSLQTCHNENDLCNFIFNNGIDMLVGWVVGTISGMIVIPGLDSLSFLARLGISAGTSAVEEATVYVISNMTEDDVHNILYNVCGDAKTLQELVNALLLSPQGQSIKRNAMCTYVANVASDLHSYIQTDPNVCHQPLIPIYSILDELEKFSNNPIGVDLSNQKSQTLASCGDVTLSQIRKDLNTRCARSSSKAGSSA
ncbi:hypothetical protein HYR53_04355 [Candidatus Acetothermia bacterium]|nr:hypothetical protein [Candidatus Acetothermia bacterium]